MLRAAPSVEAHNRLPWSASCSTLEALAVLSAVRGGTALNVSAVTVEDQVARVAERLECEYADRVPTGVVQQLVDAAYTPMKKAKVTQFVPVLVDRTVREQLRHG